ncbi:MAG: RNA polymerase sigma factor ShbA [Pseudonocardiaceae bacterium]
MAQPSDCTTSTGLFQEITPKPPGRVGAEALLNELVALAVRGDRTATAELLVNVRAMVLPYCRARLGDKQRAIDSPEDVAQEVCFAVLVALARYQIRGMSFRAFVYGIAAHKVTDAFRAAARERSEPVADPADDSVEYDDPEQRVLRAEQSERLGRLLAVLSDRQREILVLRLVIGFTAAETAQAVHSTPGSVRVLQHRALNQLRDEVSRSIGFRNGAVPPEEVNFDLLPAQPFIQGGNDQTQYK